MAIAGGEISSWIAAWGIRWPAQGRPRRRTCLLLAASRFGEEERTFVVMSAEDPVAETSLTLAQRTHASRGVDTQKSSPLTH
jgi:hypothetical protein